jgi:trans-2-enoyl-CoA reductase
VAPESSLLKVKNDIKPEYAASIAVNPCTAYRLLNDFADLKPGTTITPAIPSRSCFHLVVG